MARYGRSFPPSTTNIVAAQLTVPLLANAAITLPDTLGPLVVAATAVIGILANAAITLPDSQGPLVINGSAAVGVNAIVADANIVLPGTGAPLQVASQVVVGTIVFPSTGLWSSQDLLNRCLFYAQRPTVDESISTTQWYNLLTEANADWVQTIAAIAPYVLYGPPTLLQTTDRGLTYSFGIDPDGNPIYPIGHVELRQDPAGREWILSSDFDMSGDFIQQGNLIRFPGQKAKTFNNGPWARFITPGGTVNATSQPTVNPPHIRMLLVARALINWATRGGLRDPSPFERMESRLWFGDPNSGSYGFLAELKTMQMTQGAEAVSATHGRWWSGLTTGEGYSRA
jgi:hypothetical protein